MTIPKSALVISVTFLAFVLNGCGQGPAGIARNAGGILGDRMTGKAAEGPSAGVPDRNPVTDDLLAVLAPQGGGTQGTATSTNVGPRGDLLQTTIAKQPALSESLVDGTKGTAPNAPRPIPTVQENLFVPSVGQVAGTAVGNVGLGAAARSTTGLAPSIPNPRPTLQDELFVPSATLDI